MGMGMGMGGGTEEHFASWGVRVGEQWVEKADGLWTRLW